MIHSKYAKKLPENSRQGLYKQQGIALITVMLIVALAAVIATQMTSRLQMQIQRTSNVELNQQAYWYAMGAEAFAKRVLIDIFKKEPDVTNLEQAWAAGAQTYPVDFGSITGEIIDLQACLNLNALTPPDTSSSGGATPVAINDAREALVNLIEALNIEGITRFEAESMGDSLTDWLDKDSDISGAGGAEDDDYASNEFPYLAANSYLSSVNELRVIAHFTPAIIEALRPHVCVIPNNDLHQININTISEESPVLLQALLGSRATSGIANDLFSDRGVKGFSKPDEFTTNPEVVKLELTQEQEDQFVVVSEYFSLKASANFSDSYFSMTSTMHIENKKKITVISRTIGRH